jgi:hypothetical protein
VLKPAREWAWVRQSWRAEEAVGEGAIAGGEFGIEFPRHLLDASDPAGPEPAQVEEDARPMIAAALHGYVNLPAQRRTGDGWGMLRDRKSTRLNSSH